MGTVESTPESILLAADDIHTDAASDDYSVTSSAFALGGGSDDTRREASRCPCSYVPRCVRRHQPPPMDARTYKQILVRQGRLQDSGEESDTDDFTEEEKCLRQDMLKNKVVWVGSFWPDCWFFMININPVLAMCHSHPLHPISKAERFLVYGFSFVAVTLIAAICFVGESCLHCDACADCRPLQCAKINTWCLGYIQSANLTHKLQYADENDLLRLGGRYCCMAETYGILTFLRTFGTFWGSTLYSFVANCVVSIVCFQLMLCGCVQNMSKRNRLRGEFLGHLMFGVLVFYLCVKALPLGIYGWRQGTIRSALRYFIGAKAMSWIGATAFNFVVFTVLFYAQRPTHLSGDFQRVPSSDSPVDVASKSWIMKALNPGFNVHVKEYAELAEGFKCPSSSIT